MSCHKCKKTKCGCADQPLFVPPTFSNDPTVCPEDSEKCTELFLAECVCWPGPDICEFDIKTGDRMDEIFRKLILTTSQISCNLAGDPGDPGAPGTNGTNGLSAYETWLQQGNTGTEQDFLDSLIGADGADGTNGVNGAPGNGIVSTVWTSNSAGQPQNTQGTTDTYTITYNNATTDIILVYNGADGATGAQGISGNIQTGLYVKVASNGNFLVPPGVTQLTVELVGGGSGSSLYQLDQDRVICGGGGGGYVKVIMTVIPGTSIPWVVGDGGPTQNFVSPFPGVSWEGDPGEDTTFANMVARGGNSTSLVGVAPPFTVNLATGGNSFVSPSTAGSIVENGQSGVATILESYGPTPNDFPIGTATGGAAYHSPPNNFTPRSERINIGGTSVGAGNGIGGVGAYGKLAGGGPIYTLGAGSSGSLLITYFI